MNVIGVVATRRAVWDRKRPKQDNASERWQQNGSPRRSSAAVSGKSANGWLGPRARRPVCNSTEREGETGCPTSYIASWRCFRFRTPAPSSRSRKVDPSFCVETDKRHDLITWWSTWTGARHKGTTVEFQWPIPEYTTGYTVGDDVSWPAHETTWFRPRRSDL